ncbi:MAG: alpha/beta fold hydrolase [Candidatus Eisenbacteria bacterium]|nr:alpha/beta fold hydrolase [Candidatus Eisenbacteria bacterium]
MKDPGFQEGGAMKVHARHLQADLRSGPSRSFISAGGSLASGLALVCATLASLAPSLAAQIPAGETEVLEARYVLLQLGREAGYESARWRAEPGGGWTLSSRGEVALSVAQFPFEQETRYDAAGRPGEYALTTMAGGDSQYVAAEFTADSLHMRSFARGDWRGRDLERPAHSVLLDNFLTSHTQTLVWSLMEDDPPLLHVAVPQRLVFLPAKFERKGAFAPSDTLEEDRGQPMPVDVPAEEMELRIGPVRVHLVVESGTGRLLQASVPSQGLRFELREMRRGGDVVYRTAERRRRETEGYRELELQFDSGGLTLTGSLTLPQDEGPFPAVLFLAGSGPMDRDATMGPNAPLRSLAHELARRGFASYRFDKRTYLYPHKLDPVQVTLDEEILDDAEAALRLLMGRVDVREDQVFVVGHSLGATAALLLDPPAPGLRGAVLLAPMGRPFTEVLASQMRYIRELAEAEEPPAQSTIAFTERILAQLDSLRAGTLPEERMILGAPAEYILDLEQRDVIGGAHRLDAPILILQGGKDYQVTEEDAQLLEQQLAAQGIEVTVKIFPELGHHFMPIEGTPRPEAYETPGRLDRRVVDHIANWMRERMGAGRQE